jgi:hypothetical protein
MTDPEGVNRTFLQVSDRGAEPTSSQKLGAKTTPRPTSDQDDDDAIREKVVSR